MLAAAENAAPVDAVEAVTRALGAALRARSVSFLIADLSGRALVRLAHVPFDGAETGRRHDDELATVVPFDGGPGEQALRTQAVQVLARDGGWTILAPVTDRGEAIGLLELVLPVEPGHQMLGEIARTAHALAFVVIANRRHTDLFEWGQRTTPFTLSAEIQRRLLPGAFTCEAGAFTLSGWLEPAASIGGDTFDYSLARDLLHFSVTDAMGHGVASALTATLGVGSLRNTRRGGLSLIEQADAANAGHDAEQLPDCGARPARPQDRRVHAGQCRPRATPARPWPRHRDGGVAGELSARHIRRQRLPLRRGGPAAGRPPGRGH
jgi:hypothetical protein